MVSSVTNNEPLGASWISCARARRIAFCSSAVIVNWPTSIRFGLGFLFLVAIGCSPEPKTATAHVWDVSPGSLMRTAKAYEGLHVRVRLQPGTYHVTPAGVALNPSLPNAPVGLVFECRLPPTDNAKEISLVGVVSPVVRDGTWRTNGVDWETRVRDCSVSYPRPTGG